MIKDASEFKDGQILTCDICIIGSGAAGLTIAHQLLGSGKDVIVLEGSKKDDRQPSAAANMDALAFTETHPEPRSVGYDICDMHRFCDPVAQEIYRGTVSPEMHAIDPNFLTRSRIRVYGGTTNCWQGWTRPLAIEDFDRSDLDPLMVWPITRADLEPFYAVAQRYCSLPAFEPYRYDQPDWWLDKSTSPVALVAPPAGTTQTVMWTAMKGPPGPGYYDGTWDFQLVWGPAVERDARTTLVRNANARRIIRSGDSINQVCCTAIDYAESHPRSPHSFYVNAKQFVLAAGGIESVRLLLLSDLRDRADTLGRYFMVHPLNNSAVEFKGPIVPEPIRRLYSWAMMNQGQYPPNFFAAITPTIQMLREKKIGNIRAKVEFNARVIQNEADGIINLNWEQVPSRDNRIRLSENPGDRDLLGDPRVVLDWRHGPVDQRTVAEGGELAIKALHDTGLLTRVTKRDYRVAAPGDHHMGATRMSISPQTGYVDPNCRVHGLSNLFIASSSVFPTGGYANPTLTIIALAARLASHLRGRATAEFPEMAEPAAAAD